VNIQKYDIVFCSHENEDGTAKNRPVLVIKILNTYEFYGYPITSQDHTHDYRARCMPLQDWQQEGLAKPSFLMVMFNNQYKKQKYSAGDLVYDKPFGKLTEGDLHRLYLLANRIANEQKNKIPEALYEAIDWNAVYKDVQRTFGFVKNIQDADAVYVLQSGKILDTKGPASNHQHENIANFIEQKYKIQDLDANNGSIFMNRANAIRVTPWLTALFLPKRPVTDAQCETLKRWIETLRPTANKPFMISNLSGSDFMEVKSRIPADDIIALIKDYYVSGHLSEALEDDDLLKDVEYYYNEETGTTHAIVNYKGKRTRLRSGVLIIKDDTVLVSHEKGQDELAIPGGGLERNETPIDAGIRECQEEVHINIKNCKETNHNYCTDENIIADWVKEHVPEDKQWVNYYTFLLIADYDSEFDGKVEKIDQDKSMLNNMKWVKIDEAVNLPTFKEEWKAALKDAGYLNNTLDEALDDSLTEDDDVTISGTGDVWEGLHGAVQQVNDNDVVVVIYDFPSNNGPKRITQTFNKANVKK